MNAQAMVLRTFGVGAQILKDLGVCRMRVMSQPKQMHGLSAFGLTVEVLRRGGLLSGRFIDSAARATAGAAAHVVEGEITARGRRVAIAAARFNDFIVVESAGRGDWGLALAWRRRR